LDGPAAASVGLEGVVFRPSKDGADVVLTVGETVVLGGLNEGLGVGTVGSIGNDNIIMFEKSSLSESSVAAVELVVEFPVGTTALGAAVVELVKELDEAIEGKLVEETEKLAVGDCVEELFGSPGK